ncbi:Cell division protein FtsQ [Candidatus Hepatincola sp. Av]
MLKKKRKIRKNSKRAYRRNLRGLLYIFSFCVFLGILYFAYNVYKFTGNILVSDIVVNGASNRVKNIIYKDLRVLNGERIVDLKLYKIQAYLEHYNWVAKASVSRKLTGQLEINIVEKNPYFMWLNDSGNYRVINNVNEVVNERLSFPLSQLIVIEKGTLALQNADDIKFLIYKDFAVLQEIRKLVYNGYRWDIQFKNGMILKLSESNINKSYDKFLEANRKYRLLKQDIQYIDATSAYKLYIMPKLQ